MCTALLPLCLLVCASQAPQAPKSSVEILALQHLCAARPPLPRPLWGSMLRQETEGAWHDLLLASESQETPFDADHVAEMLQSLNRADVDADRLAIARQGNSLVVHGEGGAVANVRQQLDTASAVIMRALAIEVCVWDATDKELPSAILGPRDYAKFADNRTPLWRRLTTTHSGVAVALDRERWTRYVYDVNPEVAQKQSISTPQTDAFCEGGRVVVRPHLLVGGDDLVLHVQFALAQRRGSVRSLQIGVPGAADIDVPLLETCFGACSGRVVNGGALVVRLRGSVASGGQVALTVHVMARTPPAAQGPAGLGIFPCGALTSPALTQRVAIPSFPPNPNQADDMEPVAGFGCMEIDQLVDLARSALPPDQAERVEIQGANGHLFVRGEQPALAAIEALLGGLQDHLLRNATVRFTVRLQGDDASAPPSTTPLHDLVAPTLLGRELSMARILETNVVRGLEVFIAQEASMVDPVVEALQIGSWLGASIAPLGTGQHLLLQAQCAEAPQPAVRTAMPTGGILMPTEVASTRVCHDGAVVSGQAVEHGDGPAVLIDGRTYRSTITTTVTW